MLHSLRQIFAGFLHGLVHTQGLRHCIVPRVVRLRDKLRRVAYRSVRYLAVHIQQETSDTESTTWILRTLQDFGMPPT